MKRHLVFVLSMVFVFTMTNVGHAAGAATLSLSPGSENVSVGDSFNLTVRVAPNGELLDTVRAVVSYPAEMLQVTSWSLGSLFPSESPGNIRDNVNGYFSEGGFIPDGETMSTGTFGTVTFQAVGAGVASVDVSGSSRLIRVGSEKGEPTEFGSATITIADASGIVPEPTPEPEPEPEVELNLEEQALVYFGAFYGHLPSNGDEWAALHCIAYGGCQGDPRDEAAEEAALVIFGEKYAHMPATEMEWNVIHTLAYTDFLDGEAEPVPEPEPVVEEEPEPVVEEPALTPEEEALTYFGTIFGRMPANDADWEVVHCIAYNDCLSADIEDQQAAIDLFIELFGYEPTSDADWNVVHALIDAGLVEEVVEEEVVEEEPVVEEDPVETDKSLEEQALVYFGAFYGRMPSSGDDWSALHCIAYGGCQGDPRDIDAEEASLVIFGAKYAKMPETSMEWNVIHTLAYTDFLTVE